MSYYSGMRPYQRQRQPKTADTYSTMPEPTLKTPYQESSPGIVPTMPYPQMPDVAQQMPPYSPMHDIAQQIPFYPPMPDTMQQMPFYPIMPNIAQQMPLTPTSVTVPPSPISQAQLITSDEDKGLALSSPTITEPLYTQGYLKSKIGSNVKIDFLIGTNMLVDKAGTLVDVGISYIVIREAETDDLLFCDMYAIKFVKFYY